MNFESPNALLGEAQSMLEANQTVMRNRTLINRLFNGEPPHTEAERMAENIKVNVNWLEATRIAANATNQLNNAFFRGGRFFSVIVDKGDPRKRHQYAASITKLRTRPTTVARASRPTLRSFSTVPDLSCGATVAVQYRTLQDLRIFSFRRAL
jgi:hypothetical protein